MPKRIVNSPVMVQRDGKLEYPMVGQAFDFTSDEIAEINRFQPKALGLIIVADDAPVVAAQAKVEAPVVADEKPAATPLTARTKSA